MGCLNSEGQFQHWFSNIHLSGPCNRSCYFCIGQHMLAVDKFNNLDTWPLDNIKEFVQTLNSMDIKEINLTGTNTDPLLYKHPVELISYLRESVQDARIGIRTNGAMIKGREDIWSLYDKGSVTICSFDREIYQKMMGQGTPPDLEYILSITNFRDALKVNVVLGPENSGDDLLNTMYELERLGVRRANLREPYGQPHIGAPKYWTSMGYRLGMPVYSFNTLEVMYWDVHYVEVESVNLYANGYISKTYPVTKGHDHDNGIVLEQVNFPGGRVAKQWEYS